MPGVLLGRRALRDLRRLDRTARRRVLAALQALERGEGNLDIRALAGHPAWLRLRIGDWRVLYRRGEEGWAVERIVDRRDLERAVVSLPE